MTSGHEQERLSAYLDGELPAGERAAVDAHLGACAECAARLAELAAVDEATRSLPPEAPGGYFDAFPARVRARLEPKKAGAGLPVWTWAAAAALLLAIVTPLTLLQRRAAPTGPPARELPAPAPPAQARPQAPPEAQAPETARDELKAEAQPRRPARAPAASVPASPEQREPGFAAAPALGTDARAAQGAGPALSAAAATREEEGAAVADVVATPGALGSGARNQAQALESHKAAASPRDADAPAATAEAMLARGQVTAPAAGAVALPKPEAIEADWQRLDAARPRSPGEWRRLREEWRRFAAAAPGSPHADEARVRSIEAGYEAWRAGGDPADEAICRRDAAAYLEREDAKQKPRVRELGSRE